MLETFLWCPDVGAEGQHTERNLRIQFGEGYVQIMGDGINTYKDIWPVTFTKSSLAEAKAIRDFVRRHKERVPFWWTPPMEDTPAKYIAVGLKTPIIGGYAMIVSFTMERVYREVPA